MLVGTKEVSLSFFLFCCSANSLALASSVEMMFFIFALEEKQILKYIHSYLKRVVGLEVLRGWILGIVIALLWYLVWFLREKALLQKQALCFQGNRQTGAV